MDSNVTEIIPEPEFNEWERRTTKPGRDYRLVIPRACYDDYK